MAKDLFNKPISIESLSICHAAKELGFVIFSLYYETKSEYGDALVDHND